VFRDEMRLLYVALTRAKERIYISGVKKHGYNPDNSWYGHILNAIQDIEKFQHHTDGTLTYVVTNQLQSQPLAVPMETTEDDLPVWAESLAPREIGLTLIHASDALKRKEQVKLLTQKEKQKLFKRGQVFHRLLEYLPLISRSERSEKGLRFLKQAAFEYSQNEQGELLQSAQKVMDEYSLFFDENSKAEVPIAATIGKKRFEGVVDRLIVTEDKVIALDYKTNAQVPNDIPKDYVQQMHFYKKALAEIFPDKEIQTALIWTSLPTPRVDWV
jgi:ATP-dependent helicase/nuclease subunit A